MSSLSTVKDLYFFLMGYRYYSEPYPVSCLTDTRTSDGEDNYVMTGLYRGHEVPPFRALAAKKWKQTHPWN